MLLVSAVQAGITLLSDVTEGGGGVQLASSSLVYEGSVSSTGCVHMRALSTPKHL
jgi:hypothetical protein